MAFLGRRQPFKPLILRPLPASGTTTIVEDELFLQNPRTTQEFYANVKTTDEDLAGVVATVALEEEGLTFSVRTDW